MRGGLRLNVLQLLLMVATAATTVVLFVLLYTCHVTTMPNSVLKSSSPAGHSTHRQILSSIQQPPSNMIKSHKAVGQFPPPSTKSGPHSQGRAKGGSFKIPYMGNYDCDDSMCTEFLSPEYTSRCQLKSPNHAFLLNGSCHFMNGTNRTPVALASFPGSGNTWVRGLLEQATGICTGAVYCDKGLRRNGFNGEGYSSGVVIAVKTHFTRASWSYSSSKSRNGPPWGSGILIIRNPRDALVAEWNRELSGRLKSSALLTKQNGSSHTKYIGKKRFGDYNRWDHFVRIRSRGWVRYFIGWVLSAAQRKRPLLVIKYENLKTDVSKEMARMLKFLKVPFSKEDLKKRMWKSFETFLRPHPKEFEHFTPDQEEYVRKQVESIITVLKIKNNGDALGLEEYLEPTVT